MCELYNNHIHVQVLVVKRKPETYPHSVQLVSRKCHAEIECLAFVLSCSDLN